MRTKRVYKIGSKSISGLRKHEPVAWLLAHALVDLEGALRNAMRVLPADSDEYIQASALLHSWERQIDWAKVELQGEPPKN